MPSSYRTNARQLVTRGGIPLLVLVLTASVPSARAADRTPSPSPAPAHSTRDLGHPAATGLEPCPGSGTATKPAAPAATTPGAPGAQPHDVAPANPRDKSAERGGGSRLLRRSGDGRVMPRAPIEEPRRGGVGMLIGITFA
jgi:hypothetical protein